MGDVVEPERLAGLEVTDVPTGAPGIDPVRRHVHWPRRSAVAAGRHRRLLASGTIEPRRRPPPLGPRRLDPRRSAASRPLLVLTSVVLGLAVGALALGVGDGGPLQGFDERTTTEASSWVEPRPWAIIVLDGLTFLGSTFLLVVVVGIAAGWLWRPGGHRAVVFLVGAAATSTLLNAAVKSTVDRARPDVADRLIAAPGASFVSGHALGATVVFGALLVAVWPLLPRTGRRPVAAIIVAVVVAVGASRVLLGVHYPTDVVGGHLLGLAWLAGWAALIGPRARGEGVG